jgi:SAM-dependent methyltransferase
VEADEYIRGLAAESLAKDDAIGWWDTLYLAAGEGVTEIPWDRGAPHRLLASWAPAKERAPGRALVVGAGLGGDAEYLAAQGWATIAFDVSPTAVRTAQERFPDSAVEYLAADLFELPDRFAGAFDLVLESMTVQALPRGLRSRAIAAVRRLVAPGGTLLVIAAAIDEGEQTEVGPPWPLTRREIESFATSEPTSEPTSKPTFGPTSEPIAETMPELAQVDVEEFNDDGMHRWRGEFRRARSAGHD